MGTGEENTSAKTAKTASSTQVSLSLSLCVCLGLCLNQLIYSFFFFPSLGQEIPTTPSYADWSSSMQVYVEYTFVSMNYSQHI